MALSRYKNYWLVSNGQVDEYKLTRTKGEYYIFEPADADRFYLSGIRLHFMNDHQAYISEAQALRQAIRNVEHERQQFIRSLTLVETQLNNLRKREAEALERECGKVGIVTE